jgi:putative ABC transport system ATP-binding protein
MRETEATIALAPDPTDAGPDGIFAVRVHRITKVYGGHDNRVTALSELTIGFRRGSFTAIMGPSGSGKSTLMHCAAGLDRPTSGQVFLGNVELTRLSEHRLTELRRERVGFVFQSFNLVPSLTAIQNILLPLRLASRQPDAAWVSSVVQQMGLEDRLDHRPSELSGGQQQRVAIARALVVRPDVIFADEPTGELDTRTSRQVMAQLRDAVDSLGQTVVMVTHDPSAATHADAVVFLVDGRIVDTTRSLAAELLADRMTGLEA